jgi:diguanylate cyclase (GGDEF)-like protein/PAS domain S-box-containing protein
MLKARTDRLSFLLVWGVLLLIVLSLISTYSYVFITKQLAFESYLTNFEIQLIDERKNYVQTETGNAALKIESSYVSASKQLRSVLKSEVKNAIAIIKQLQTHYEKEFTEQELVSLIKETLRPIRFADGNGYIFIDDFAGNSVLLPPSPQYEGRSFFEDESSNAADVMLKIIEAANSKDGSGFVEYQWYKPGKPQRTYQKISYVEVFKPLNIIIGSGDYLQRARDQIIERSLAEIDKIRFGEHGYVAVIKNDGTLLKSVSARQLEGLHYTDMPPENSAAIKKIIESAQQGESFINYKWFVPGQSNLQNKTSFIQELPFIGWILVSGVYEQSINVAIAKKRAELSVEFRRELIQLAVMFLIFAGIFIAIAYCFTRWLTHRFKAYHQLLDSRRKKLKSSIEKLKLSERIVMSASEGIMVTDTDNRISLVNDAFTQITGYSREEVIGETPAKLSSGLHDSAFYKSIWDSMAKYGIWEGEIWNRGKDGHTYPQWIKIFEYKNIHGEPLNYIATFSDLSEQKEVQAQASYLADYDPLTDLPNKRVMIERINQVIAHTQRYEGEQTCLISIDLDHFKRINDALGHESGDKVLIDISKRLKQSIREEDMVGRVSGDEFLIVLEPAKDIITVATQLAFRLLEAITQRLKESGTGVNISASMGIAIAPEDGKSSSDLLKNANLALNHAKKLGRNNFQFFTQSMNESATKRILIENLISTAVSHQEMKLKYQPQYRTVDQKLCSVEALIRWEKADGTIMLPCEFIPIAEQTGQIIELGEWILNEACCQAAKWLYNGIDLPVSVNISPVQILSDRFYDQVVSCLEKNNLDPRMLLLEITETALMTNEEVTIQKINELKELGLKISLDDFGTGYSSLSLLKKVPVSELKIDRSFVDGLPFDKDDESICASIISVAKNMGLEVVAEGVETQDQLRVLAELECFKTQGYYFSPAVTATEIEILYSQNQ